MQGFSFPEASSVTTQAPFDGVILTLISSGKFTNNRNKGRNLLPDAQLLE
jgi:hypothetical protein